MLSDEGVIEEVRISPADALDLVRLSGAECFLRIEAPNALQQSLPPQHFVDAGDAAAEAVGRIEHGSVRIREFVGRTQQFDGNRSSTTDNGMTLVQQLDRLPCPHRPLAEQPADDASLDGPSTDGKAIGREQIENDVIVIAGVQGNILAAGLGDGTNNIEGLVAIERRDLDGHHALNFEELPPEAIRQKTAADSGLKIKTHDRQHLGDGAAVNEP